MDGLLYTSPPPPPPQKKEGEETGGRKERKQGRAEKEDKEEGKTSEGKRKGGMIICQQWGFPIKPVGKESACSAGDGGDRVRSLGWEDPLEKEMTTHSSNLAWRIPWTEEPGGLQTMGSQRVRLD